MTVRVLTMPVRGHRHDTARTAEPVTFGVPLPKGLLADPAAWRIRSGSQGWRSVQTRVLDRWVDGSARWVLVDAQIDTGPDRPDDLELDVTGGDSQTASTITVTRQQSGVLVDTGTARFELGPGRSFPVSSVTSAGSLLDAGASRLEAIGQNGVCQELVIGHVEVEHAGPLRVVVRLVGSLDLDAGKKLDVTARVHFFAGSSTLRLQLTVTNPDPAVHPDGFWDLGDPGSILIKDLSIRLALTAPVGETMVQCSPELGSPSADVASPFELYQDSSGGERWQSSNHINRERRIPVTFRGYRIRSGASEHHGLRATPVLVAKKGDRAIGTSLPHFWQNFPKALEASDASLTLRLFPGQFSDLHELQGGEQKTHECWLSFGTDTVSVQPLDWCRSPTLACVDPAWTLASGAVPLLAPLHPDHAAFVQPAIDGSHRFELKREVIDQYGWRNFGEIYGDHESVRQPDPPVVSHYNNQYDPVAGFIFQYLRTADPRWWIAADELATHVADIDVYHTDRDKSAYNRGLFWHTYHYGDADTATHRTYPAKGKGRTHGGGPSADHNYTTGLMHHFFLTGSEISKRTVIDLARYVINLDDGRKTPLGWIDSSDTGRAILSAPGYYGPGRGPANSLNALVDGHRLSGDPAYLAKAEQLVQRVVHPTEDITRHRLDAPEERWFYVMFLQVLGKYLGAKLERGQMDRMFDYGRGSLLHYARWMTANERPWLDEPEKLEFPTESWAVTELRKSDVFFLAALYAGTEEERRTYLERGAFFFRNGLDTARSMPTSITSRPIAVALSSGFVGSALEANTPPLLPLSDIRHQAQPVFVPQKQSAKARLKKIAVGLAAVVLTTVAGLVVYWW